METRNPGIQQNGNQESRNPTKWKPGIQESSEMGIQESRNPAKLKSGIQQSGETKIGGIQNPGMIGTECRRSAGG